MGLANSLPGHPNVKGREPFVRGPTKEPYEHTLPRLRRLVKPQRKKAVLPDGLLSINRLGLGGKVSVFSGR
jgi:hypothetical protein